MEMNKAGGWFAMGGRGLRTRRRGLRVCGFSSGLSSGFSWIRLLLILTAVPRVLLASFTTQPLSPSPRSSPGGTIVWAYDRSKGRWLPEAENPGGLGGSGLRGRVGARVVDGGMRMGADAKLRLRGGSSDNCMLDCVMNLADTKEELATYLAEMSPEEVYKLDQPGQFNKLLTTLDWMIRENSRLSHGRPQELEGRAKVIVRGSIKHMMSLLERWDTGPKIATSITAVAAVADSVLGDSFLHAQLKRWTDLLLERREERLLTDFTLTQLTDIWLCLPSLGYDHNSDLGSLRDLIDRRRAELCGLDPDLSLDLLCASSALGWKDQGILKVLSEGIQSSESTEETVSPFWVSDVLLAYQRLGMQDEFLLDHVCRKAKHLTSFLSPDECIDVLKSLGSVTKYWESGEPVSFLNDVLRRHRLHIHSQSALVEQRMLLRSLKTLKAVYERLFLALPQMEEESMGLTLADNVISAYGKTCSALLAQRNFHIDLDQCLTVLHCVSEFGYSEKGWKLAARSLRVAAHEFPFKHAWSHTMVADYLQAMTELSMKSTPGLNRVLQESSSFCTKALDCQWILDEAERRILATDFLSKITARQTGIVVSSLGKLHHYCNQSVQREAVENLTAAAMYLVDNYEAYDYNFGEMALGLARLYPLAEDPEGGVQGRLRKQAICRKLSAGAIAANGKLLLDPRQSADLLQALLLFRAGPPFELLDLIDREMSKPGTLEQHNPAVTVRIFSAFAAFDSIDVRMLQRASEVLLQPGALNEVSPAHLVQFAEMLCKMSRLLGNSNVPIHSRDVPGQRPTHAAEVLRDIARAQRNSDPSRGAWDMTTDWDTNDFPTTDESSIPDDDESLSTFFPGRVDVSNRSAGAPRHSAWSTILGGIDNVHLVSGYPATVDRRQQNNDHRVYHPYISNTILSTGGGTSSHQADVADHGSFMDRAARTETVAMLSSKLFHHLETSPVLMQSLTSSQICRLALAFAAAGAVDWDSLEIFDSYVLREINTFSAQQMVDLMWAYTATGGSDLTTFHALAAALLRDAQARAEDEVLVSAEHVDPQNTLLADLSPQDLAHLSTAVVANGQMGTIETRLLLAIRDQILWPPNLDLIEEQDATSILWAFAFAQMADTQLVVGVQVALDRRAGFRQEAIRRNLQLEDGIVPGFEEEPEEEIAIDDATMIRIVREHVRHNELLWGRYNSSQWGDDLGCCIVCKDSPVEVKIRKLCRKKHEGDALSSQQQRMAVRNVSAVQNSQLGPQFCFDTKECPCRPQMCESCLAQWICVCLRKSPRHPTCPTCRTQFCLLDIFPI